MIKSWMACLAVVGLAVLLQAQMSLTATQYTSTSNATTNNASTSEPPTSWTTMNISQSTTANSTGTGGFSLYSSNLLFLPLTVTASIFYLSC